MSKLGTTRKNRSRRDNFRIVIFARPLGMQGQQLLSQRPILQNEVCWGPKHSRQPAEQVSKWQPSYPFGGKTTKV